MSTKELKEKICQIVNEIKDIKALSLIYELAKKLRD